MADFRTLKNRLFRNCNNLIEFFLKYVVLVITFDQVS